VTAPLKLLADSEIAEELIGGVNTTETVLGGIRLEDGGKSVKAPPPTRPREAWLRSRTVSRRRSSLLVGIL
jgi:hypothetical protein